jgi:predicted nucleic acid-binding protein
MMISLDTNVVLRFLLNDVPEQTKKATDVITSNKVYVTDVVVIEVIYVLEKVIQLSRKDIVELTTSFLGFASVVHNPLFLVGAIILYGKHPSLSIVDCYAAAEAREYGNKLVTFDRRLVSQGGEHVASL